MISHPSINAVTVNHNTSLYLELMLHFFCVSYIWEPTQHWNEAKAQRRDELLSYYRQVEPVTEVENAPNQLLHPHGELTGVEVMIDTLDDNLRRLKRDLKDIDDECLHWQVDPTANSIAVTLWHMGRLLDVFTIQLALGLPSEQECWFRFGWAEATGYDPRGQGRDGWGSLNEYSVEEVAALPRFSWEQLSGYLDDVYQAVGEYLKATSLAAHAEPGVGFDGKFSRYQIISMALMDNVRHLGEIRLIKSLWDRSR